MKMKRYKLLLFVLLIVGCENATDAESDYNSTCVIAFYDDADHDGNGNLNVDFMCYSHSFQSVEACNAEKLRLAQENNAPSIGLGSYGAYFLTDSNCTEHCNIVMYTPQETWIAEDYSTDLGNISNINRTCSLDSYVLP